MIFFVDFFMTVALAYLLTFFGRRLFRDSRSGAIAWTTVSYWIGTWALSLLPFLLLSFVALPFTFISLMTPSLQSMGPAECLAGIMFLGLAVGITFILALGPGGSIGLLVGAIVKKTTSDQEREDPRM